MNNRPVHGEREVLINYRNLSKTGRKDFMFFLRGCLSCEGKSYRQAENKLKERKGKVLIVDFVKREIDRGN